MHIVETYILPMCFKHAPFVKEAMQHSPAARDREKMGAWLQSNIIPINSRRIQRFIYAATKNIPPLH